MDISPFTQWIFSTDPTVIFAFLAGISMVALKGVVQSITRSMSGYSSPIALGLLAHRSARDPRVINITLTMFNTTTKNMALWTLMKDSRIGDVFINPFFAYIVGLCAKRCTEDDPVIRFKPIKGMARRLYKRSIDKLYEHVYNTLISAAVHECDPMPAFEKANGSQNIDETPYIVALTFEKGIPDHDQHFRCVVVRASLLDELEDTPPEHLSPRHKHRYRTLLAIRHTARTEPRRVGYMMVYTRKDEVFPFKSVQWVQDAA